ncbi:hypothetical protein KQH49_12495 [Mycetohabitans sp. B5]|uniref:Uncharacterized protein n=1 Tax=Mycetohabitans endofungorum TaxID=417203 RepID=A0A2P5KCX2_9BURK|nr:MULTISPECIES: hypothetical protein [Mycetohabitans]MCG1055699.1 hypothetical protein [Mycetohabitans sp. B5]PPB84567.1 hypothetical protein B0O95_103260 [Mycetohabitans endofungorum]
MPPLSRCRSIPYLLYSIPPTLVEVGLMLGFFIVKYEAFYLWLRRRTEPGVLGSACQAQCTSSAC